MSYREKNTWLHFLSTLVVFIPYFCWFWYDPNRSTVTYGLSFSLAVVASTVLTISGHAVFLWRNPDERPDERDWLIEYRALRVGYLIHGISIFLAIGLILYLAIAQNTSDSPLLRPVIICHVFLFCFILAELVRYGGALAMYRKGA